MRNVLVALVVIGVVALACFSVAKRLELEDFRHSGTGTLSTSLLPDKKAMGKLSLTSTAFAENTAIPSRYTCDGANISPPLAVFGVSQEAKSLVLIMDDPDTSHGTWDHWVKFNLSPRTTVIEEGKEPEGVAGIGSSGNSAYKGPCPPDGEHRYFFKLYALDAFLSLSEGSTKQAVEAAMEGHLLEKVELVGRYKRK